MPFVEQEFGSWYVRGGLRRLAQAVCSAAVERGAVVRTGTPVERVLTPAGRRLSGVPAEDDDRDR